MEQHNVEPSDSDSDVAEELGVRRTRVKRARSSRCDHIEPLIIKVHCKEDIIKFEFDLPLGISKLFEKVGKRLNLKANTFKLKYVDEDNDEIMMTHDDEDLHLCCYSQTTKFKPLIRLLVRPR
ncbi:hypothetical protein OROHE_017729 [Orobanche hederae]